MDRQPVIGASFPATPTRSRVRRYEQLDRVSRVESATPHTLVMMLYDELIASLDVMTRATTSGDTALCARQHERAVSILNALQAGLDLVHGGDVATLLASIYTRMRRSLTSGRKGDQSTLADIRDGVFSLKTAWEQIER